MHAVTAAAWQSLKSEVTCVTCCSSTVLPDTQYHRLADIASYNCKPILQCTRSTVTVSTRRHYFYAVLYYTVLNSQKSIIDVTLLLGLSSKSKFQPPDMSEKCQMYHKVKRHVESVRKTIEDCFALTSWSKTGSQVFTGQCSTLTAIHRAKHMHGVVGGLRAGDNTRAASEMDGYIGGIGSMQHCTSVLR